MSVPGTSGSSGAEDKSSKKFLYYTMELDKLSALMDNTAKDFEVKLTSRKSTEDQQRIHQDFQKLVQDFKKLKFNVETVDILKSYGKESPPLRVAVKLKSEVERIAKMIVWLREDLELFYTEEKMRAQEKKKETRKDSTGGGAENNSNPSTFRVNRFLR